MKRMLVVLFVLGLVFLSGNVAGRYLFKDTNFSKMTDEVADCKFLDIYLLAGQSNMEGGADLGNSYRVSSKNSENIFVYGKDFNWYEAEEPIFSIGKYRSKAAQLINPGTVGPSLFFAEEIIKDNPGLCVGLLVTAWGGSNIASWQRSTRNGALYNELIERALAAKYHGSIAGLLFFQGENDTEGKPEDHPHDWSLWFENFVQSVREDLNDPNLKIVFAQIGHKDEGLSAVVKAEQARIKMSGVSMIKTDDLSQMDNNHFTFESYQEIGSRFAEAMIELKAH